MFIISRSIFFLRVRNVSDKSSRENQKTLFSSVTFFENLTVYEIMWKNIVEPGRSEMTTWRMRIVCWIPKATNSQTQNT